MPTGAPPTAGLPASRAPGTSLGPVSLELLLLVEDKGSLQQGFLPPQTPSASTQRGDVSGPTVRTGELEEDARLIPARLSTLQPVGTGAGLPPSASCPSWKQPPWPSAELGHSPGLQGSRVLALSLPAPSRGAAEEGVGSVPLPRCLRVRPRQPETVPQDMGHSVLETHGRQLHTGPMGQAA